MLTGTSTHTDKNRVHTCANVPRLYRKDIEIQGNEQRVSRLLSMIFIDHLLHMH